MTGIEIRRATRGDLDEIERVQIDSRESPAWEPLSYLDYDCRVACITGGRVVGFIVSREVAPRQIRSGQTEHGEREILSLAVDPANRRQGIGRALVEAELAAASKGTTRFLEVRESNIAAISLYAAMGFSPAGRRPGYYHDPAEAAIVMRFFS